jgi:dTDP-4-amino-4,6-dideoxygalactose transaminase
MLLARLDADNARRSRLAESYALALTENDLVEPVIQTTAEVGCAWHIYPVLLRAGVDREAFCAQLRTAGVQTSIHYPPLHRTSAFAASSTPALPSTERYARRTVTLPLFPHMTDVQQQRVVNAINGGGLS